jgi:beta-lactamase class A
MVRTLLYVTLLLVSNAFGADPATDRIAKIESRVGGHIGVAALDTGSGKRIEYRANERFPMCSTFKFLAAAAVLERVDKKQEQLDRFVRYDAKVILEYARVTEEHLKYGGMTLSDLCEAALELSDNTAGNLLLNTIGGPQGLTKFVRSLGDKITRLDRNEPELNSAAPGDVRDTTTPASMLADMKQLLVGDVLSPSSRNTLEHWLWNNQTGAAMIRAVLPADWRMVGDKTGRGANGATNDIAIIRPPTREPILLAVYSVGSVAPDKERAAAIADVAKVVVESLQ